MKSCDDSDFLNLNFGLCLWVIVYSPFLLFLTLKRVAEPLVINAFSPPVLSLLSFLSHLLSCQYIFSGFLCFFFITLSSAPPFPSPFSISLLSPARKINCPAVFRACWAITTRWKNRLVMHFQSLAVNLLTARLPLRRSQAHLCLVGNSVALVVVAAARAVSGLLLAPQQGDLHPSPRNAQDSRVGTAASGATGAVAVAAVAKDTEEKHEKRSRVNTAQGQSTQSHTHRVQPRGLWAPPAATATRAAPCLPSSITPRSATAPSPHETERPTGTRPHEFTPPSTADSTRVRPFPHLSCPSPAPCNRSPQPMCGLWTARKRQSPRVRKQKATVDNHTATQWERWRPMARLRFRNSRSRHSL